MAAILSGSQRTSGSNGGSMTLPITGSVGTLLTVNLFQRTSTIQGASVLFAGSPLTLSASGDNISAANKLSAGQFFITGIPSGSGVLTASFSGAVAQYEMQAAWWEGIHASPLDVYNAASGNSVAPSVTVSPSEDNTLIVGGLLHEYASAATTGAGETSIFEYDNGAWGTNTSYAIQTTAASQAIDWSMSSDLWTVVAAVYKNAAGANATPSASLNTANGTEFATGTPTLEFTGSDPDSDNIRYNIQISDNPDFPGAVSASHEGNALNGGGGFHENGMATITWEGHYNVDDRFGISFLGHGGRLTKINVVLGTDASETSGCSIVRVYNHDGTYGVDSSPLDAAISGCTPTHGWIAQSDTYAITASMISGSLGTAWEYAFSGSNQIRLTASTPYMLIVDWWPDTGVYDNLIELSLAASDSHAGNMYIDSDSANHGVYTTSDFDFNVYEQSILIDAVSGTASGFANTITASNTDPFNSGEKISYTVQVADELLDTNYYWRVRVTDPDGSNVYSDWTSYNTFSVGGDTLIVASGHHDHTADSLTLTQIHQLTIADATHSHTADNVTLTEEAGSANLVVSDSSHAHTADNIVLAVAHNLVVAESNHSHTADALNLHQILALTIADSTHAHAADALSLTQIHILVASDSTHSHVADALVLTQTHRIVIADSTHALSSDNVTLTTEGTNNLVTSDSIHSHSADALALTQIHVLSIADSAHAHASDNVTLVTEGTNNLVISDALHSHLADSFALTQNHAIAISSAIHAHYAESVSLSEFAYLYSSDTLHSLSSDSISLSQIHALSISDSTHSLASDNVIIPAIVVVSVSDYTLYSMTLDNSALYPTSLADASVTQATLEEL